MKKLIIVAVTIISFVALTYANTLEVGFGIKLPFGWVTQSNPLLEGAICAAGKASYNKGLPFYTTVYDGVGSCGNPVLVNTTALILNVFVALSVSVIVGYITYRLLMRVSPKGNLPLTS